MNSIDINNLSNKQFEMYLNLLKEIGNKFQKNSLISDSDFSEYQIDYMDPELTPEKFKTDRLNVLEEKKNFSLKEFVIFEKDNPVTWIAFKRISTSIFAFICDSIYEDFPESLIEEILNTIDIYITENGIEEIFFWTIDERRKEIFKKAGIKVSTESITSKLLKNDIDFEKLKNIVDDNSFIKDFELRLMHEFPEELYEEFSETMNEVFLESVVLSPQKPVLKTFTKDRLINMIKRDKEEGDPMYMYVVLDKNKVAAFCRVYLEKYYGKIFIQHCGGLTGVAKKYRGKGFAKYLKAKMYIKINEDYPDFEYALTDTKPWNKYMYRINEELGFKPFENSLTFKFTKEIIENYFENH